MTPLQRRVNIAAVVVPFLAVAAAVPLLWGDWVGPSDIAVFIIIANLVVDIAYAYLDPGTGSMVLQALLGGLAAALVVVRAYWSRIRSLLTGSSTGR